MASGTSKGSGRVGARVKSLGAAAGSPKPHGAILDDNDEKMMRKQRFKAWSEGYRNKKLKPNAHEGMYPQPVKWK